MKAAADPGTVRVDLTRAASSSKALTPVQAITKVSNGDERVVATEHLKGVRLLKKTVVDHYERLKRPILDALETARTMEKEDLRPIMEADAHLTRLITSYDVAERERVEAENRRLQAEENARAEARRREEAEALRAAAKATEDRTTKQALNRQARTVAAAPLAPREVETVAADLRTTQGVGATVRYVAQVHDEAQVVLAACAAEMLRRILQQDKSISAETVALLSRFTGGEGSTPLPMSCVRLHETPLHDIARQLGTKFTAPGVIGAVKAGLQVRG